MHIDHSVEFFYQSAGGFLRHIHCEIDWHASAGSKARSDAYEHTHTRTHTHTHMPIRMHAHTVCTHYTPIYLILHYRWGLETCSCCQGYGNITATHPQACWSGTDHSKKYFATGCLSTQVGGFFTLGSEIKVQHGTAQVQRCTYDACSH